MSELRVVVDCSSMFISTQFFRFGKAVEQFYYGLLFTTEEYAGAGANAWESWADQGFHIAIKSAPPAVRKNDHLKVDTRPGRTFELTAESSNRGGLMRLSELLQEIERARTGLPSGNEDSRTQALLDNPAIESWLVNPIREALKRNAISSEAKDAIWSMIRRGLSALANWQIRSIKVGVS
jgi:hypothetical protein